MVEGWGNIHNLVHEGTHKCHRPHVMTNSNLLVQLYVGVLVS